MILNRQNLYKAKHSRLHVFQYIPSYIIMVLDRNINLLVYIYINNKQLIIIPVCSFVKQYPIDLISPQILLCTICSINIC